MGWFSTGLSDPSPHPPCDLLRLEFKPLNSICDLSSFQCPASPLYTLHSLSFQSKCFKPQDFVTPSSLAAGNGPSLLGLISSNVRRTDNNIVIWAGTKEINTRLIDLLRRSFFYSECGSTL